MCERGCWHCQGDSGGGGQGETKEGLGWGRERGKKTRTESVGSKGKVGKWGAREENERFCAKSKRKSKKGKGKEKGGGGGKTKETKGD